MAKRTLPVRGFTLIELMVVVAIVGMLSSVAIPSYRNFQLRAKQAERNILVTSIVRAVDELWMRESRYPLDQGNGASMLNLYNDNPNASPSTVKRPWRYRPVNALDHWNRLALQVEGGVYYSYYGAAYDDPPRQYRYLYLRTSGDLDGDRVLNQQDYYWYYINNQFYVWAGSTGPCPTARCSWVTETRPDTF